MSSFHNEYLQQIFTSKENVTLSQQEMLKNIFNIYDYDGDGHLNEEEYLTLISDVVYISVLMNRFPESEYHLENVAKIARWSSSNFKSNLFRVPLPTISYELFMDGIIYALTENRNFPIFPNNNIFVISFVPELIHYFHYYVDVAKRRGWPTELEVEQEDVMMTAEAEGPVVSTDEGPVVSTAEAEEAVVSTAEAEEPVVSTDEAEGPVVSTAEEPIINEIVGYQEIRRRKYQEEKEKERLDQQRALAAKHAEQDRVNREIHLQSQRLEAEQRERERRNLLQEQQQRQILALQQLQANLRHRIRQQHSVSLVDQIDPSLPSLGEIEIKDTEEGYDPIEGNVNVLEFAKREVNDGLVFRCGDSYYLASRDRIKSMIQLGEKDNSLFYGCICEIDGDWTQPQTWEFLEHTVMINPIYYNIQQLGLPIRYVYLDEVKQVLASPHQFYSIEKPEEYHVIPSFASDNVLHHGVGSMSGLHCQEGQMDVVYRIKSFTNNGAKI
uniref:EF-hand domain-containing protein n=1 Tax=viral metagenome TaxID=1070528 RepID=A0A6C0I3Q0_9ZZZZ